MSEAIEWDGVGANCDGPVTDLDVTYVEELPADGVVSSCDGVSDPDQDEAPSSIHPQEDWDGAIAGPE